MADTIQASIYDYPQYYDAIFASDWKREVEFFEACFKQYARIPVKRLFEPACGTGRLIAKLAQRGYDVSGNDLSPRMVDYCNRRLRKLGLPETAVVGDMSAFTLRPKADAAFNTINTFRLLPTEEAAEAHLRCMAGALRKGGIYILGIHLTPAGPQSCDREAWSATRGALHVDSDLVVEELDRANRAERMVFTLKIRTPSKKFHVMDRFVFRIYSAEQFRTLLSRVPDLECVETYNFSYDISSPIQIDEATEDAIFILRRR